MSSHVDARRESRTATVRRGHPHRPSEMKSRTRRPRTYYQGLYQRRLDEGLICTTLSADSSVSVATLQYWSRRFKASEERPGMATADDDLGPLDPACSSLRLER